MAGLLGAGLLGQGIAAGNRHIGPPYYLVNDTFTTNRAAGAVNGTNAEPGPGRRSVVDSSLFLSTAGGALVFAGRVAAGDPGLDYGPIARAGGLLGVFECESTTGVIEVGFDANTTSNISYCLIVGVALGVRVLGTGLTVGAASLATPYRTVVAMRAEGGAFYFIKGGTFTNWTLIWLSSVGTSSILYPRVAVAFPSTTGNISAVRVPAARWLPTPLLSDGFSAWGTADGLGHAEGVAGGLGSGGSGLTYTVTGTWGAAGGAASASALSSGSAIAYTDTGKADAIVKVAFTRVGGDGGLLLRFADSNNFMSCRHDGTNVVLIKKVAGSNTTVRTTATTYVAGAELTASMEGSKVRIYYNNVLVGAEDTIADAALVAATKHGVYTTNTGNTFDNLVVNARGTGGEYAALDAF